MVEAQAIKSHKDVGNEYFKQEMWLKAAACYTKGIKDSPEDPVLYSNRCAALLKLQKAAKALADADTCIKLKPDWQKGYYRKAMVLEAMGNLPQALTTYEEAAKVTSGADLGQKISSLKKSIRKGISSTSQKPADKENGSSFAFADGKASVAQSNQQKSRIAQAPNVGSIKDDHDYDKAKAALASAKAIPLSTDRIQQFGQEMVQLVQQQLVEKEAVKPSVFFLPGKMAANGQEQMGQVQINEAFQTPDLLQNCLGFLRKYASDMGAHAACAVVPKQAIAYPQVWKMKGWPLEIGDGVFVQLEALKLRKCWFVSAETQEAQAVSNDYKLLEPIFR